MRVTSSLISGCDNIRHPQPAQQVANNIVRARSLTNVQNDVLEALDQRCGVILVLFDMAAAFDTVDNEILLSRLEQRFGMSGPALMWMRSYLSDRWQSVNVPGGASGKSSVACGVPQGSRNSQAKHHITVIKIGDCDITPSPTARNIGAVFDSEISMVGQVKYTCRIAYFHLRNIASIRSCLTQKAAVRLIYSLVISRIDYANCLLHGIPDCLINKLQRVHNAAAQLMVRCHRWDHITPVLKKLPWLPVKQRIHYAILLLAFRARHGLAPAYITNLLHEQRATLVLLSATNNDFFLCNKALLKLCDKEEEAGRGLQFKRYDIVVIEKNKDRVKELQEGHGGWKASFVSVLGKNGIVNKIDEDGDVFVEFPHTTNQWFNPKLLTVVDTTNVNIRVGDLVMVIDSYKKVKALQDKAHGGWTSDMRKFLGSASIVVDVLSRGRVKVFLDRPRVFNVKAVRFISRRDGRGAVDQRAPAEERTTADESALPEERAPAAGNWMENTKASIRKILPSLELDVLQAIMDHFVSIGVESESDLRLIKESDLEQFLKPIQRRKLVSSWEANGIDPISNTTTSDDTSESDPDSDSGMPSLHSLTELKELLKGLGRSTTGCLIDSDDEDDDDDDDDEYLGKVGVVKGKLSGNIVVQFPDGRALLYNKALLTLCDEEDTEEENRRSHPFRRYDIVVIEKNKDRVMALQEGHGGWKASLVSVLGKNAIVNRIDEDGDVFLELPDDTNQYFNPKLLTVIDTRNVKIGVGDLVVVVDCYKTFRALQKEAHVVWTSGMRKVIIDLIIEYL
ncbi:hypothetical protein LSAT2_012421 [Lamellibrachia satsuma]|nr:hypothetical protein LSAT2_012421 [Lamellibrachia satsuma]